MVSAVLPDDLITLIVQDAARDTPTALALALVSTAVGRMAESVLYASITLRSIAAARTFSTTLWTKSKRLLAGVAQLALTLAEPRHFDSSNFWVLVGERCPHITHLSLSAANLAHVRGTRLQPRQLRISFGHTVASFPLYAPEELPPAPWGRVTHLCFTDRDVGVFAALPAQYLCFLTHFSCVIRRDASFHSMQQVLQRLLSLPVLRVCMLRILEAWRPLFYMFSQHLPMIEHRKMVVVFVNDMSDEPDWERAERDVAARAQQ